MILEARRNLTIGGDALAAGTVFEVMDEASAAELVRHGVAIAAPGFPKITIDANGPVWSAAPPELPAEHPNWVRNGRRN